MATLVLSTVGNALGGPVVGAIGALLGQSIDQAVLAPVRRGPRVGDLAVQTSSYGTQIPRIYGRMRVAGTVVWATDLVESSETSGAKGQPDVTYSYSVSLAVALSSRVAGAIGRIWADGKLLRGAAGDFKVDTEFRFYDGSKDQVIDPLIGSIEGIASTPAYRGLALAVFENLQLAQFGNRIPLMTFEVVADEAPPSVAAILADASGGLIAGDASDRLVGYAAYGASMKHAVQPLVDCFGVELFDDGSVLRAPGIVAAAPVTSDELGNSAEGKPVSRIAREQTAARDIPGQLRLTYYDPARDYQTGEAQADAGELRGTAAQQDLPAVLEAGDAKAIAHRMIARSWSSRDRLTLRLPPSRLGLEPGARLELDLSPPDWSVEKTTVEGFVVVTELRPWPGGNTSLSGDSGRIAENPDSVAQPLTLALLDLPAISGTAATGPVAMLAASSPSGWQRRPVEIRFGDQSLTIDPARLKTILGRAEEAMAPAGTDLVDEQTSIVVALVDQDQWLTSCDDDALAAGENLAAVGNEVIQFGSAQSLEGGRFRLSRLLRGRGGTEWASAGHVADEQFCLLKAGTLQPIALPSWSIGSELTAVPQVGSTVTITFIGESQRPLAPVNLTAEVDQSGDLKLSWTRRSRQGFAWVDGIDAPLGESSERYTVDLSGAAGSIDLTATEPALTVIAADLAVLGAGVVTVEVRQIGDFAASRPAQLTITLS